MLFLPFLLRKLCRGLAGRICGSLSLLASLLLLLLAGSSFGDDVTDAMEIESQKEVDKCVVLEYGEPSSVSTCISFSKPSFTVFACTIRSYHMHLHNLPIIGTWVYISKLEDFPGSISCQM